MSGREVRRVIREAMEHIGAWKRQEVADTICTLRQAGKLSIREIALAVDRSERHVKRVLHDAGLSQGKAASMPGAVQNRPTVAPPAAATPPAPAGRPFETVEESQRRQMVEAHDRRTAAMEVPQPAASLAPTPPAPAPPPAEAARTLWRTVCEAFSLRDKQGFVAHSSDGAPAHRYGIKGEGTTYSPNATHAVLTGHGMDFKEFCQRNGLPVEMLQPETKAEANAAAIERAFGGRREATSRGNLMGMSSWVRSRNQSLGSHKVKVGTMEEPKFVGHRPDGSTYEF